MYFSKVGGGDHTEHRSSMVWGEKVVLSSIVVTALSQNWTNRHWCKQFSWGTLGHQPTAQHTSAHSFCGSWSHQKRLKCLLYRQRCKRQSPMFMSITSGREVPVHSPASSGAATGKRKLARPLKIMRAVECHTSLWTSLMQLLRGEFFT